jgi:5-methylthioadenosine/S-adenosylhomocysteine deaminase
MVSVLIRNATVLPFTPQLDGSLDLSPQTADVLVEGDRIMQVAPSIEATAEQVFDATDQLLIPGFVDAHTHTVVGVLEKCGYEALPLELWMLYLPPDQKLDPRMHYLCAAIGGLEAIKNGTTTLQDDLYALPYTPPEIFEATAQAYSDLGIRASLSLHAINRPLHHTIPYLEELLPDEMKQKFSQSVSEFSIESWTELFRPQSRLANVKASKCQVPNLKAVDLMNDAEKKLLGYVPDAKNTEKTLAVVKTEQTVPRRLPKQQTDKVWQDIYNEFKTS